MKIQSLRYQPPAGNSGVITPQNRPPYKPLTEPTPTKVWAASLQLTGRIVKENGVYQWVPSEEMQNRGYQKCVSPCTQWDSAIADLFEKRNRQARKAEQPANEVQPVCETYTYQGKTYSLKDCEQVLGFTRDWVRKLHKSGGLEQRLRAALGDKQAADAEPVKRRCLTRYIKIDGRWWSRDECKEMLNVYSARISELRGNGKLADRIRAAQGDKEAQARLTKAKERPYVQVDGRWFTSAECMTLLNRTRPRITAYKNEGTLVDRMREALKCQSAK